MNPLQSRLADLRRRLRLVVTFRGGCWAAAALVGSLTLACLIDQLVHVRLHRDLPGMIRAIFLTGILAGTGYVAYRFLFKPMTARTDDLSLALRVEDEYPILNDALASTVEFLHHAAETPPGTSTALQREAVGRAMRLAQGCDFNKAVDARGTGLAAGCLFGACALVVLMLWWNPGLAATSLVRIADPFGGHLWPADRQQTFLEVTYPPRLGFSQPFTIHATVTGVIPAEARFEFEGRDPSPKDRTAGIKAKDGVGKVTHRLDMTEQRRNFKFRVRANDAVSPAGGGWHHVELRRPPSLAPLDKQASPQIVLTNPKYTDLEPQHKLAPGTGIIEGVAGTFVQLRAATDRPIVKAWVEYRPLAPLVTEASYLTALGNLHLVGALASTAGGHAVWGKVDGTIKPGGKEFAIDFLPWTNGAYLLKIEDAEGLTNEFPYDQKILPDPVPTVSFERPNRSQNVLPNAEITVRVLAEDEVFAVRNVYLEYRVKDKDGRYLDDGPRRLPLYDHEVVGRAIPQIAAALAASPIPAVGRALRLRQKRVQTGTRWALGELDLKEGDVIVVQACAHDFNDVVAFNLPGRSVAIELRVVKRQEFVADLDDAQAKLRQDLVRLGEKQKEAIKKVVPAEQQWRATGKLRPEDAVEIAGAEQLQKEIQERVGQKPDEGLRGELARLQEAIKDNKLPASITEGRLKAIKDELDRLAREHLPEIEPRLTNARRDLEGKAKAKPPSPKTKGDLGRAREHQEEVRDTLADLLKHLDPWAGAQEIRGKLRNILEEQRRLQAETEKLELDTRQRGREQLRPQEEAKLREMAAEHRRLAKETEALLGELKRLAEERAANDPSAADAMKKAAELGRQDDVPATMRDTAKQLQGAEKGKFPNEKEPDAPERPKTPQQKRDAQQQFMQRARDQQAETVKTLEQMAKALDASRDADLERLARKQANEQKNLQGLKDDLERLRKKVDKAKQIADPKERAAEMKKLAEEQRQLQEQLEKKGRELARLQAPQAARALDQAAQKLERAAKQLDQGEDPENDQKEALERLEQAQEQLQQAQQRVEEELAREQLARIADQLKGLKERQDAANVESTRLHKGMLQNNRWSRGLVKSLSDHQVVQEGLAKDTASAREKLKGAAVFELILDKTAKAMTRAAERIQKRVGKAADRQKDLAPLTKEELAAEEQAQKDTQKLQQEASRRLQRLLDAIKQEPNVAMRPKKKDGDPMPKEGEPKPKEGQAQKGIPSDGIPPLAQLKALRSEQQEVNDRTREFAERHPNVDNLPEAQRAELAEIHQDQERLSELFRKMAQAVNGQGGNP